MMYCNFCGKPNPEGSAFCSWCGKPIVKLTEAPPPVPEPVAQPVEPQPVPEPVAQPVEPQPAPEPVAQPAAAQPAPASAAQSTPKESRAEKLANSKSLFTKSWRGFATSPLVLALIICYTVMVSLSLLEIGATAAAINPLLMAMKYFGAKNLEFSNVIAASIALLLSTPGVLTCVGLWWLYIRAQSRPDDPVSTGGFILLRFACQFQISILVVALCAVLLGACTILEGTGGKGEILLTAAAAITITVVIAGGIGIALINLNAKVISSVMDAAVLREPDTRYLMVFAIIQFISGGLSVMTIVPTLLASFSLSPLVSCAIPVLAGIVALKYRSLMNYLSWERYHE